MKKLLNSLFVIRQHFWFSRLSSLFTETFNFRIITKVKPTLLGFWILKFYLTVSCACIFLFVSCEVKKTFKPGLNVEQQTTFLDVEKLFKHIPDSIQISVYWYWISDNISKEGVIKDLNAMKKIGINRAFIGNIGLGEPYGKVKLFSDEWWDITHQALKTATELGVDIGIFNSPGWSQSGGPWIKPSQSMRYLASTETQVSGGKQIDILLNKPDGDFQDVKVIAFPTPENYNSFLNPSNSKIGSLPDNNELKNITDQSIETCLKLSSENSLTVDFKTESDYTVRSIAIYPHNAMYAEADFQVKDGNNYQSIKKIIIDRTNTSLIVGFEPLAPVVISVPEISGTQFRVIFDKASFGAGISELLISSSAEVERYAEKSLAKMFPKPLPYWKEYQWKSQPVVSQNSLLVNPNEVKDVSNFMDKNGRLHWDAPKGSWVIMRTGMLPTRVVNDPASPEGIGLEVDKMNKNHVQGHFEEFLGRIIKRVPEKDRISFKVAVQDSYEKGGQNWTDSFLNRFMQKYGYNALPFLPVFKGKVVGSRDQSDRFLWDLRRFVADNVAYEYVGGLRDIAHQNGLTIWLENYGHWGFPGEFLQYGGQSDEIAGEFWNEGDLGNIENRAASSAAHIYGKTKVSAESFTAGGQGFARYPLLLKQRGDRFFTEGINNTLLHVYIHQPDDILKPGINAFFGTEFNRHNTWFYDSDLFIQYLKRCNFMLQQGKYVADVAYFIGEDTPKMTGVRDPELPSGYSYDYINAEVIESRLSVKNGKLILPDGMSYSILVLPKLETMRPKLLIKIKELVAQGAVILGPKPNRSPSLENYPLADNQIKNLATELWGTIPTSVRDFGKGKILNEMDMQAALDLLKIKPDYEDSETDPTLFIHRKLNEGDIYFISNQSNNEITLNPKFRITGKQPEFWDAVNGATRNLVSWSDNGEITQVPLKLAPSQSAFIIFRTASKAPNNINVALNFPTLVTEQVIDKPWTVTFDANMRGPNELVIFDKLEDWTTRSEDAIKYYSGSAYYRNSFNSKNFEEGKTLLLDLGGFTAIAKVKVNGKEMGGAWTFPYHVDITNAVKRGENEIEIKIVNNWVNRLIGDAKLPEKDRKTFVSTNIYNADSSLQPSGLLGPVVIKSVFYSK